MGSRRYQVSGHNHRWLTVVLVIVFLSGVCVLGKHFRKKGSRAEQTRGHHRGGPRGEKEDEQTREKPSGGPAGEEEARIAQIREHLLQQLGITEIPTDPKEYVEEVSEEVKEEYHILVEAQSRELLSQSAVEGAEEHEVLGAKKVSSFRGDIVEVHSKGL